MVHTVQLIAMMEPEPVDESVIIEQEHKGERDKKIGFYPDLTPEYRFQQAINKMCTKKATPTDRVDWKPVLIGIIKDYSYLLGTEKINGQFPLSFAFNRRDIKLTRIFARAEHAFFADDRDSQIRRSAVLYSAVKVLDLDTAKVLLKYGAPTKGEWIPDLLIQVVTNCNLWKQSRSCCMSKKINKRLEERSCRLVELLVEHGAPLLNAFALAQQYNCLGSGCALIRKLGFELLGSKPSAPPAENPSSKTRD